MPAIRDGMCGLSFERQCTVLEQGLEELFQLKQLLFSCRLPLSFAAPFLFNVFVSSLTSSRACCVIVGESETENFATAAAATSVYKKQILSSVS